jgi:hypothetical protein
MRVLSIISRGRGSTGGSRADACGCARIMMATIRALEPAGGTAAAEPLQGLESLFSRVFRQGDRN